VADSLSLIELRIRAWSDSSICRWTAWRFKPLPKNTPGL